MSRNRRAMRSISASTTRRSSSRSDSSSPFRRAGAGLLSVLRQKFSLRIVRGDGEASRYHGDDPDAAMAAGTSATLSGSWRSSPRHVDKPIRPAYSDECLSCCGRRSTCLRSRTHHHQHQISQALIDLLTVTKLWFLYFKFMQARDQNCILFICVSTKTKYRLKCSP